MSPLAAARPHDHHDFARLHREVDAVQDDIAAEALAQGSHLKQGGWGIR